jgi:hypothetical protein
LSVTILKGFGLCGPYSEKRKEPGFGLGNLKGREFLEDLTTDGRCMLKYIFNTWIEVEVWMSPAQDAVKWRTL